MDHAEQVARRVLEATIIGSRMVYRSDQSLGVHDFDLHYPDGRVVPVEVTASVDEALERTNAAITDRKKGGSAIKTKLCKKDWYIHPEPKANINQIRAKVDEYLAAIESEHIERFFSPTAASEHPSVERIYIDLGITGGSVIQWKDPGYIRLSPPGGGGSLSADTTIAAIRRETFKADNRRKLAAASGEEKHLAVYIFATNYLPWCALTDLEPAPELPELPPEITDIWAFSESRGDNEFSIWRAGSTSPWHKLENLVLG
jgi:hypothetical protein